MGLRGPGARPRKRAAENAPKRRKKSWEYKGLSRAERVIRFIESLTVTSGMHAGRKFKLRPWQREIVEAWYAEENGARVVDTGLLTMGRKNGKTGLVAALALAHLIGPESEPRGQIVAAAADSEQAGIVFNELEAYLRDNDEFDLRCNVKRHYNTIEDLESGSTFKALSSDAKKSHGLSPSVVIIDELAQWGDGSGRALYDALITAGGARKEPITFVISTQAADDTALMSELVDYGKRVNKGEIDDPSFSAFIFETDPEADPFDEACWVASNPALGDFRSLKDMRKLADRAQRMPSYEGVFRNLYLNQRVATEETWLPMHDWKACGRQKADAWRDMEAELAGRPCYGGIDLSSTRDTTALVWVFPPEDLEGDEPWSVLWRFWLPGEGLADRSMRDRVPWELWSKQGALHTTPGNVVDYRALQARLFEDAERFDVRGIAIDKWNATQTATEIYEKGLPIEFFRQGYVSMSAPTKQFERLVMRHLLDHGNHPIATWMAGNVVVWRDQAENVRPDKAKSIRRIDGIVAAIMAVGLTLNYEDTSSVYETRGVAAV